MIVDLRESDVSQMNVTGYKWSMGLISLLLSMHWIPCTAPVLFLWPVWRVNQQLCCTLVSDSRDVEKNMQLGDICLKNEIFSVVHPREETVPSSVPSDFDFLFFSFSISWKKTVPQSFSPVLGKWGRKLVAICAADTVSQCNEACCTISAMRQAWEVL